jgi:hypothetical protein
MSEPEDGPCSGLLPAAHLPALPFGNIMKKKSLGWGGDSHPAEEPQAEQDSWQVSQTYKMDEKTQDLKWVVEGTKNIAVFKADEVDPGYASLGVAIDHHGPVAHGVVTISHMWTVRFTIEQTNIDLDTLYKIFKKWANKPVIGHTEINHPFRLSEVVNKDGVSMPLGNRTASDPGSGWQTVPKLWNRTDQDLRTDIQRDYPGQDTMRSTDVSLTTEPYECLECNEVFSDYKEMLNHVSFGHPKREKTGPEYEIRDNDESFYPDNESSRSNGLFYEAANKGSELAGPMPFIYDIESDRIRVGEPGDQKVDIGEYNSFGMVEGYYTPDEELIIATQTSVPYAINHVKKLWNYMYPEYEVKHIYVVHKEEDKESVRERVSRVD